MSKSRQTRRNFVKQSVAASAGIMTSTSFYTALFATTKAIAESPAESTLNEYQKKYLNQLTENLAEIDHSTRWAVKLPDGGGTEEGKWGGPMEEPSPKAKK